MFFNCLDLSQNRLTNLSRKKQLSGSDLFPRKPLNNHQSKSKEKENANARKYLVCAPTAYNTLIRLLLLFACISVHLRSFAQKCFVFLILKKWCRRPESNRHEFPHHPLKMACLPISPRRRIFHFSIFTGVRASCPLCT